MEGAAELILKTLQAYQLHWMVRCYTKVSAWMPTKNKSITG
ncbi:hypothetical protein JCM19239_2970 [Vibrio variabilis]|uniref:Uncharacterized protein n=1 Tax=Vibrio variabilis TaxID=990271 RepID=A0ABQ0J5C7_9VIBR|nr:hypothetical protein JCM19239_2970 [Vibrio variabilis]